MAAANGDDVSGSPHFLLKAVAAVEGKKPAGKGRERDERHGTRKGRRGKKQTLN